MRREALDFLKRLVETPSPSGFEQPAQKVVRQQMADIADEGATDVHGNVIGVLNRDAPLRVMLAGHVDEIGMMVTHISEKGYIHCSAIGGVDVTLVPGQRVHVHNQRGLTVGVVGKKAIHLLTAEERKRSPRLRDLWIDIGAKDRKDALKAAAVGDPITFAVPFGGDASATAGEAVQGGRARRLDGAGGAGPAWGSDQRLPHRPPDRHRH